MKKLEQVNLVSRDKIFLTPLVTSIINTSTTITNSQISTFTWPIEILGGSTSNPTIITFGDNITLNSPTQFFIIGSDNVIIEGNNKIVELSSINEYPGLFQNGTSSTDGYSNIIIRNFSMFCGTSTQEENSGGGWICQRYYGKGGVKNLINNLSSDGIIYTGGGICGSNCGQSGELTISDCFSTGVIFGADVGGIVGFQTGFTNGKITISKCYTTGQIVGFSSGGIIGKSAGESNGTVNIIACYSTGNIRGSYSGGIIGSDAGQSTGIIAVTACYSTGNITGLYAGGIVGGFAGFSMSYITITSCYSTGDITGFDSGGIIGSIAGYENSSVIIKACYSTGIILGENAGGIVGADAGASGGNVTVINCYSTGSIIGKESGGIIGSDAARDDGIVSVINCCSIGLIIGSGSGGIVGSDAGDLNGTINITNSYSSGSISGDYSGGIAGQRFGFNSNNLCEIVNSYSMGNISGVNSGGIVGSEVGLNNNSFSSYTPQVNISNCYTLGIITNNSGSICGGNYGNTYTNTPIVKLSNCYSLNGPIVSPTLQITPKQTTCGVGKGIWSDSTANQILIDGPTYSLCGKLINPVGSVWIDYAYDSNSTPWLFSTFGYSPYTLILTDTYSQSIQMGATTNPAIYPSGHVYSIASINNNPPIHYPKIKINSLTGSITVYPSNYSECIFNIKVLEQSDVYTVTNFILTVEKPIVKYCLWLKTCQNKNVKLNLNKDIPDLYFVSNYFVTKKPSHGKVYIEKCGKLIYIPAHGYIGCDEFILECISLKGNYNKIIYFKVKIQG
jgi:hypothetical protein